MKSETPPQLRIYNGHRVKINVQWEPRDLWIGVFWRKTSLCLHIYICLVPLLPIHITLLLPTDTDSDQDSPLANAIAAEIEKENK